MAFINVFTSFIFFISACYFAALYIVVRKRGIKDIVTRLLVIYLVLSIGWEVLRGFSFYLYFHLRLPENLILHLPYYGLLILGFLFLALTTAFIRKKNIHLVFWLIVFFGLIIVMLVDGNLMGLPDVSSPILDANIDLQQVSFVILVIGWSLCIAGTTFVTITSFRRADRIAVKQRIVYWSISLCLTIMGGIFFWVKIDVLSSLLQLLGTLAASYIITIPRLPDHKQIIKQLTTSFLVLSLEIIIFSLSFRFIQIYLPRLVRVSPFLTGLILALFLLVLNNHLYRLIQKWVGRFITSKAADKNRIFNEYSLSISNIVDLFQLSNIAIGLINEVLDVKNGFLFTVDPEFDEEGKRCYRLKSVPDQPDKSPVIAMIPVESPIAERLGDKRQHLLQSEIDVLPAFRFLTQLERGWINTQELEVLLPIHFRDEWVGVFAFGPKRSGARFYDDDIDLLTTLANQTSVALQNARLVSSLVRINNEFRRAYTAMEEAHSKLAGIDRTKSDFISIASHELRTPLTVLSGYSQMLLEETEINKNDYYGKIIAGISEGTSRLHEIVDSMLDIAKIDTRALELEAEPVKIHLLINELLLESETDIQSRDLTFELGDLSELPSVYGDPEALKKVFYHLFMNAIKFTPDGSAISINGNLIPKKDIRKPNGGVEIIVSDTGIGIDPRFKELIFTKFYQTGELALHSTGKTKFKGSGPGLGLAIVRGIVQAHGGRVWVESPGYDEDKYPGSSFHIILPIYSDLPMNSQGELYV